jgi:hypothetical protein
MCSRALMRVASSLFENGTRIFPARTHKWVPRRHFLSQPPDGIANHFFFQLYFDEETLLSEGRRGQRTADGGERSAKFLISARQCL